MKKKIFALMMALVMALPLAACGDEPGTPDNNTAADDGSWGYTGTSAEAIWRPVAAAPPRTSAS